MRPSTSNRYSTALEICVTSVVSSKYVMATVVSVAMGWKVADWIRLPTLVSSTTPIA
ncbi:hypothetical protein D3C87_2196690 [compost metagenome]